MSDQESTSAMLRRWLREQTAGQDEIRVPELAAKAIAHFKDDPEFPGRLVEETLPAAVAELAYSVLRAGRGTAIRMGDAIVTREGFEDRVERSRFRDWMEHAGDRHISLLALTKTTGRQAIAERRARAAEEERRAAFIERLIKPLRGNQTVGERWTEEQISELWDSLTTDKRKDVA